MATITRPVVSWWWDYTDKDSGTIKYDKVGLKDGKGTLNLWDLGVIKAGNDATIDDTVQTFYIWNNKGGQETAQHMTNCELTIRDGNSPDGSYFEGNADSPLVKEKWVEARLFKTVKGDEASESQGAWTKIGLNEDGSIAKLKFEALGRADQSAVDTFGTQEISGGVNTGSFTEDVCKNNYAKVQMRLRVPSNAEAGQCDFIGRIYYSSRVV